MRALCAFALLMILFGGLALAYGGDGALTDRGIGAAHSRYILDLGIVDLSRVSRREYRIADLPREEFTFGLNIPQSRPQPRPAPTVRIALVNERNQTVFDITRSLAQWTWSETEDRAFVYVRGSQKDVRTPTGGTRTERVALRPDSGWGTYFEPRRDGRYTLTFEIIVADPHALGTPIRLHAIGGGWK